MKMVQMVALTNVVLIAIVAMVSMLWPWIGSVVGYGNSWWLAPLASFGGFVISGRLIKDVDLERAFRTQFALLSTFYFGTLLWSVLIQHLGIPAWRVVLTLALSGLATWLGRLALGRLNA
jgi:hypothetical protein